MKKNHLSDGRQINKGIHYWLSINPITWTKIAENTYFCDRALKFYHYIDSHPEIIQALLIQQLDENPDARFKVLSSNQDKDFDKKLADYKKGVNASPKGGFFKRLKNLFQKSDTSAHTELENSQSKTHEDVSFPNKGNRNEVRNSNEDSQNKYGPQDNEVNSKKHPERCESFDRWVKGKTDEKSDDEKTVPPLKVSPSVHQKDDLLLQNSELHENLKEVEMYSREKISSLEERNAQLRKKLKTAMQPNESTMSSASTQDVDDGVNDFFASQTIDVNEATVDSTPMTTHAKLKFFIENKFPVMLHGPSGVGKSRRVEDIDPNLTNIPLFDGVLPEDIVGKTRYASDRPEGVWTPPDWYVTLKKKCDAEKNKVHVLFIDEVTNASENTQSLIYNIVLNNSITVGNGKLPENCTVVLAGNNKEESSAAYNMPEPLFRRSAHIYMDANIPDWLEWGSRKKTNSAKELNIHPIVSSFVATNGNSVFYTPYDEDEGNQHAIDPRGWEQVSNMIYANRGKVNRDLLETKLDEQTATDFMEFAKHPPLSYDRIISGSFDASDIPSAVDEKLALVYSLRYTPDKTSGQVSDFVQKFLGEEYLEMYSCIREKNSNSFNLNIQREK